MIGKDEREGWVEGKSKKGWVEWIKKEGQSGQRRMGKADREG